MIRAVRQLQALLLGFLTCFSITALLSPIAGAQEMSVPRLACEAEFLKQEAAKSTNTVCVGSVDDAFSTEVRVGQATLRHIGMGFEKLAVETERRCDCEFGFGRYDLTPRKGLGDSAGWKRWYCKKALTKDGKSCGSKWYNSDEGFRPFVCNPTQGHSDCTAGSLVAWLQNPDTNLKQLVPIAACAEADPLPRKDGKPSKDVLVLIIQADNIPRYKNWLNGCMKLTVRKDPETKLIQFYGTAFNHPIENVRTQPLIRGILKQTISD